MRRVRCLNIVPTLAQCSPTQIDRVQNRGTFLWTGISEYIGNNQVENSFLRISNISVPCPHAQFRGRKVIENYGHFLDLWDRIVLSHRHVEFFG